MPSAIQMKTQCQSALVRTGQEARSEGQQKKLGNGRGKRAGAGRGGEGQSVEVEEQGPYGLGIGVAVEICVWMIACQP